MQNILLSIVVPVLNESRLLADFLDELARQEHVRFEVILCDGGSTDNTVRLVEDLQTSCTFPLKLISSRKGRGRQMNTGARAAQGQWLLFMHVDTMLDDSRALMLATAMLQREHELPEQKPCAGHFQLHFVRKEQSASFSYFFYESKTRLDFPDCIHGDQGIMMHRRFFQELGGYEEGLDFLEDSAMSDSVNAVGRWVLLPSLLKTSARRFETEGLRARQTLNALIMNFRRIGWQRFFDEIPEIYRLQSAALPLDLLPYWFKIRELLKETPSARRWRIWLSTGAYVRSQAWQLFYAWHCYIQYRHGQSALLNRGEIEERMQGFERITNNPFGIFLTAVSVWCWFHLAYLFLLLRHPRTSRKA